MPGGVPRNPYGESCLTFRSTVATPSSPTIPAAAKPTRRQFRPDDSVCVWVSVSVSISVSISTSYSSDDSASLPRDRSFRAAYAARENDHQRHERTATGLRGLGSFNVDFGDLRLALGGRTANSLFDECGSLQVDFEERHGREYADAAGIVSGCRRPDSFPDIATPPAFRLSPPQPLSRRRA